MANSISFFDWNSNDFLLSKQEVIDIIDVLFRGEETFHIYGKMTRERQNRPTLGLHVSHALSPGLHEIYLAPEKIHGVCAFNRPTGGNRVAPHLKLAEAMVLAHEIQHANQSLNFDHTKQKSFYGDKKRYRTRPCEMEARSFADDSVQQLAAILKIPLAHEEIKTVPRSEIDLIVECLSEADEVSIRDIVEELRSSGLNNAVNVKSVSARLSEAGTKVVFQT